jgi:hypothetical protein
LSIRCRMSAYHAVMVVRSTLTRSSSIGRPVTSFSEPMVMIRCLSVQPEVTMES